jgi:tRNA-dihydrouridine synthase
MAEKHTYDIVDQLSNIPIITENDIKRLEDAKSFLVSTFTDVPMYRPLVTKITSVLTNAKFPTPDKKFWQCKNEAEVHFSEMTREIFKYRRALIDIKEIEYKMQSIEKALKEGITKGNDSNLDPILISFDLERLQIKKESYIFELKSLEKQIKYRIKEVTEWHDIAKKLEPSCKYSTTDYEAHAPENHYKFLKWHVENAQTDEERQVYKEQLDTFDSVLGKQE